MKKNAKKKNAKRKEEPSIEDLKEKIKHRKNALQKIIKKYSAKKENE